MFQPLNGSFIAPRDIRNSSKYDDENRGMKRVTGRSGFREETATSIQVGTGFRFES
jgi:hypothetical protein